ncbi:C6 transcription factor [Pochonia chlamydosporia 170]|uniref:C6 transcription factor n=1 Tax=Pochonia chlamydosporia 170 TaxID=1380566 RepID=A0A179F4L9_METCM|nr:C6 transcription factor [Pochonia chlamydosporia 170]OAQ60352.1 C6 transcription factor [Pochonia chlamydosporia 170]
MWNNIIITYQRHFATELPFIHVPTLKRSVYDFTLGESSVTSDTHLVLLGLLALTGRYHSELSQNIDTSSGDAISATASDNDTQSSEQKGIEVSRYFAHALEANLGPFAVAVSSGSVERVQALLMLGLYEWISPDHEGLKAWMLFGAAGRMAQALRLGYECNNSRLNESTTLLAEQGIIDQEVRRRTMFCCFVFDRLISCGKERVALFRSEDLHIRLPCSKEDFELSRLVNMGTLSSDYSSSGLGGAPASNALSRFIQLVDLWGRISQYSNAGGRFTETGLPPWNSASQFYQLRRQLGHFTKSLQEDDNFLSWSPSNFFRHQSFPGTYVLLHMLLSLCKFMLHREYIPFIALRCKEPSGPLDEPTFQPDMVPEGFWHESAKELFDASRVVIDLIELCGDEMPHSPLAAFVIYTTGFNGMYARYFPQMDVECKMATQGEAIGPETELIANSSSVGTTKIAFDALKGLAKYSGVAAAFVARFKEVDQYFVAIIKDYYRNRQHQSSVAPSHTSQRIGIRMGGETGGLEEWMERSDEITSNSSIIKHSLTKSPRHYATRLGAKVQNIPGPDLGTSSPANAVNIAPAQSSAADQPLPSLQVDQLSHAGRPPHQSGPGGVLATVDPAPHFLGHPHPAGASVQGDCTSPAFTETGLDWSWTYLHDMFMGSIQMDPMSPCG